MSAGRSQHESDFEERFAEAMTEAGEVYRIEPTALVDTAWVRGRAIRRRRRMSVVAGAAALALVGMGGVAAVGAFDGARPIGVADGGAAPQVSGPEFQAMLTELLPQGTVEVGQAQGTEADPPQLRLTVDDGHGAVQYLFWIMKGTMRPEEGCKGLLAEDACTEKATDAGQVVVFQAGTRAGEPAGSKTWSASLYSKDGFHLMLQEWNRKPLERGAPITRTDPPLNAEQLTAVVTDPRWKKVEAALRSPGDSGGPGASAKPGGAVGHGASARPGASAKPSPTRTGTPPALPVGAPSMSFFDMASARPDLVTAPTEGAPK